MTLDEVLQFIKKHDLMVISTVDDNGKPEAAVVEFGELDDFTIVIDTLKTSRKYKNLQHSNQVALVIGWDNHVTVQISAIATELTGSALKKAKAAYFAKNKRAQKWETRTDIAYFGFYPRWIRYSDVSKNPWVIEEFNL